MKLWLYGIHLFGGGHVQLFSWMRHYISTPCNTVWCINTLRPRQNGCHYPDDIFKSIFFNENVQILIKISLTFVPKGSINNIPSLVQIMAWCRPGDKPLSEAMMVNLPTHICITRPQWVNTMRLGQNVCCLADNFFKCIFMNEKFRILIKISLMIVPKCSIDKKVINSSGNGLVSPPISMSPCGIIKPQWVIVGPI